MTTIDVQQLDLALIELSGGTPRRSGYDELTLAEYVLAWERVKMNPDILDSLHLHSYFWHSTRGVFKCCPKCRSFFSGSLGLVMAEALGDGDGGNGPSTPPTPPDTPPINNGTELIAETAEVRLQTDESPQVNSSNDFEDSAELLNLLTHNFGSSNQSDLNVSANIVEAIDETLVEPSSAVELESSADKTQNPETITETNQPVTPIGAELPQSPGVGFAPVAPVITAEASNEASNELEAKPKTYAVYAALGKYSSKSWIPGCTLAFSPSAKTGHWEFLTAQGKRIRIYVEKDFRLEVQSLPSQPQQPLSTSVQDQTEAEQVGETHVVRLAEHCRQMMQDMRQINRQFGCA